MGRCARLSARRQQCVPLPDDVSGVGASEFLCHPDALKSILNIGTLKSFPPAASRPSTFTCVLHCVGLLGFEVAPMLTSTSP
jgi:hypothetical protein|uniref:Uncharacterized protein n=1 Tax=Zea mays TaxID=4577 RepID=A0A804N9Y6_MAIZE